jgi:hypothetical protein
MNVERIFLSSGVNREPVGLLVERDVERHVVKLARQII